MSIQRERKRRRTDDGASSSLSQNSTESSPQEPGLAVQHDPTKPGSEENRNPLTSSVVNGEDEDWTSSSGSSGPSSPDINTESFSDNEVETDSSSVLKDTTNSINSRLLHPPQTTGANVPDTNIQNRLTSFFSQLAEQRANPSLPDESIEKGDSDSDSGFEDDDDDDGPEGGQYIELDLALGVLSEQNSQASDGEDRDGIKLPIPSGARSTTPGGGNDDDEEEGLAKLTTIAAGKPDALLSGQKSKSQKQKDKQKRKIEEVG